MNRDPTVVGRAKVGAELVAEVVNSFVEPISWKTLVRPSFIHTKHEIHSTISQVFALTSLSFLTVFINALLSLYRSRHHSQGMQPPQGLHHQPSFPIVPGTPSGYYPAAGPEWGRSWRAPDDEDQQAPTRRRRLDDGGAAAKIT
jgi:hypothetical protein